MIRYCQRHLIGYNDELDPTCPQCALDKAPPAADHPSRELAIAARDAEREQNAPKSRLGKS